MRFSKQISLTFAGGSTAEIIGSNPRRKAVLFGPSSNANTYRVGLNGDNSGNGLLIQGSTPPFPMLYEVYGESLLGPIFITAAGPLTMDIIEVTES